MQKTDKLSIEVSDLSKPEPIHQIAEIGASALKEIVRVLERVGLSRNLAPAAVCVAVAGCMRMGGLTHDDIVAGIKAAEEFWTEDEANVVFKGLDVEVMKEKTDGRSAPDSKRN